MVYWELFGSTKKPNPQNIQFREILVGVSGRELFFKQTLKYLKSLPCDDSSCDCEWNLFIKIRIVSPSRVVIERLWLFTILSCFQTFCQHDSIYSCLAPIFFFCLIDTFYINSGIFMTLETFLSCPLSTFFTYTPTT